MWPGLPSSLEVLLQVQGELREATGAGAGLGGGAWSAAAARAWALLCWLSWWGWT